MTIDRDELEFAIERVSNYHFGREGDKLVLEAARAHLATLPKPRPTTWRIVQADGHEHTTQEEAFLFQKMQDLARRRVSFTVSAI